MALTSYESRYHICTEYVNNMGRIGDKLGVGKYMDRSRGQIWDRIETSSDKIEASSGITSMPRKDDRTVLSPIGEYYEDLLSADSTINSRSNAVQGSSLLCAKLQERETAIKVRVEYLARKRGISFDECWKLCVTGKLEKITPEEWNNMPEGENAEERSL